MQRQRPDPGGPYPFKTRVIVRRPVSNSKFNGTVILEWLNISEDLDQENDWWWTYEHLMRSGYAYVGVSAQPRGITGLKRVESHPVWFTGCDRRAENSGMQNCRAISISQVAAGREKSRSRQAARESQGP